MKLIAAVGLLLGFQLFADDLSILRSGQHLHIAMIGQGPLCEGTLVSARGGVVIVRTSITTLECGAKGDIMTIPKESVVNLLATRRLTKGRVALKVLAALGAVAALSAFPLNSSDPESRMIFTNLVIPAGAAYAGWRLVPERRDYVLLIPCPDRMHCFLAATGSQKESPPIPGEK